MIRLDKSEMTKTICSLYSFREEGRREKANKLFTNSSWVAIDYQER